MVPARSLKLAAAIAFAAAYPALAADLNAEIVTAATHAGLAAQSTDVGMVHTHLHHTLNCLVGPNGVGFAAGELNPCKNNGAGAIVDATKPATKTKLMAAADKARTGLAETNLAAAQKDATDTAAMLKAIK